MEQPRAVRAREGPVAGPAQQPVSAGGLRPLCPRAGAGGRPPASVSPSAGGGLGQAGLGAPLSPPPAPESSVQPWKGTPFYRRGNRGRGGEVPRCPLGTCLEALAGMQMAIRADTPPILQVEKLRPGEPKPLAKNAPPRPQPGSFLQWFEGRSTLRALGLVTEAAPCPGLQQVVRRSVSAPVPMATMDGVPRFLLVVPYPSSYRAHLPLTALAKIKCGSTPPLSQDVSIQRKLDFETRMREGICKLLSLSTQKDQLLRAAKNLMVCNARIEAYTYELQKLEEHLRNRAERPRCMDSESKERMACKGKIAISGIRIPLMWKGSDHFSYKEGSQRYAIFCLFKMGAEIFDTDMVIVDKTITDICFENVTVFNEAGPDFQVKVEVYSCCTDESSLANAPKTLARRLRTSFSKATGKKINCMLQDDLETDYDFKLAKLGVKYSLLAHATLTLENTNDGFRTHTLTITGNEESSFWLPLYGNMCCRLAAQPACMAEDAFKGFLNQQLMVDGMNVWTRFYCVLRGGQLFCYYSPEEIEAKIKPTVVVPFNKETRIRAMDKDPKKIANRFFVINLMAGKAVTQTFAAENLEELHKWIDAFRQHFFDLSQWKHCCEELMKIEIMSPRKPPLFLTKEATSVYHDMSIDSPVKLESLTDIIKKKIEDTDGQFLIGEKESPPPWDALFDGTHQIVFQKNVEVSQTDGQLSKNDEKRKKRQAPLPPSDKPPHSVKRQTEADQLDKENVWEKTSFVSRASSFDTSVTQTYGFTSSAASQWR
ncbi:rhotekin-2 [Trichosurus vulpecula]|uniref:rhotekin-2 n=1 Tax=Trichosurus vulpecula TaxID=9337 RepID=UPI00186B209F|nr:rhotekin-2 [Trichosurus vulpecula]